MRTLRLPIEDRRRGLAERPSGFYACADAPLSDAPKLETGVPATEPGALDGTAMRAQLEIACRHAAAL